MCLYSTLKETIITQGDDVNDDMNQIYAAS